MLKEIFALAAYKKSTYGLRFKFALTGNTDNAVLNKANATIVGKNKIKSIEWYVPHYTASISQQAILSQQISSKTPTQLQCIGKSVFMKEVKLKT